MTRRETPVEPPYFCSSIASNYTAFRLMDVDGDGVVELVSSTDYKPGTYRPADDVGVLYRTVVGVSSGMSWTSPCGRRMARSTRGR